MEKQLENVPIDRYWIFGEIDVERKNQTAKWGEQDWPMLRDDVELAYYKYQLEMQRKRAKELEETENWTWMDILCEEVLEAATETDPARQREELIQVLAVGVQIVEAIDRKANEGH